MKEDVALDPIDVSVLRAQAVVFHPEDFSNLIEELGPARDFITKSGFIPHFCG